MGSAVANWRRFQQYFGILFHYCYNNVDAQRYMLQRGVLGQLIDLMLDEESPHPELRDPLPTETKKVSTEVRPSACPDMR
jgi:hypothetical protein